MAIRTHAPALEAPAKKLPGWRFWLPLAFQVLLVAALPVQQVPAYAWGTPVTLSIVPVDPYDVLRGRYMRVDYAISDLATLQSLPGWHPDWEYGAHTVHLTLVPTGQAKPWRATALSATRPAQVPPDAVILKGRLESGTLNIGMTEYHIPEDRGDAAEAGLRRSPKSALAEIKIDGSGNPVLMGLVIEGKRY